MNEFELRANLKCCLQDPDKERAENELVEFIKLNYDKRISELEAALREIMGYTMSSNLNAIARKALEATCDK